VWSECLEKSLEDLRKQSRLRVLGVGEGLSFCHNDYLGLSNNPFLRLNAVAGSAALTSALQARTQPTVLTPHPLEAARLLGCTVPEIQADRLRAAQNLAERYGCSVVLKGSGSVIASPGRRLGVCPRGSAALASAGTGDVLAGWLAGLWAPEPEADLHALCGRAVSQHGAAGEALPLRASTLIERLSATLGAA
jgi:NAD(P)H-hydrate repair Nnr-like enzyme with NAD(P)H-hydrate dehydratase domain